VTHRDLVESNRARILLADPDDHARERLKHLLTEQYLVIAVADGGAALLAAQDGDIDLVLSEMTMPKMDGFDLLRSLRADDRTRELPVILLSAGAGEELRVAGLEAGADDYVDKPFSPRELLARVARHLKQQRVRREALAAMRASEAKFATAFDQSPVALTITSLDDGRLVEVNEGFVRLSGYSREEAVGRSPRDLRLWVEPERHAEGLTRLRAGQSLWDVEAAFRKKSGEVLVGNISSSLIFIESRPHVLSSVADITDRKRAEGEAQVLAVVSERIRLTGDVDVLLHDVSRAIGEFLQVRRAFFIDIDEVNDRGVVRRDYCRGVESIAGEYRLSAYSATTRAEIAGGRTIVNCDSRDDPRTADSYEATYGPRGERAYVAVPLMRDDRWDGVLWVSTDEPRRWLEREVTVLETVAERTWNAVERLRLDAELRLSEERRRAELERALQAERAVAEMLQRSLLPQRIPDVPAASIGVRYHPARSEAEVGGDWYDVFELPAGQVGIAMGDVAGKGIRAAAVMGQLRAALRAYALEGYTPGETLERLNQFIDPGAMATLVYLVYEPATGMARYSNAGHLPPLVVAPDGVTTFLEGGRAAPLGSDPLKGYPVAEVVLSGDSTVVLYTDGLVEEKGRSIDDGLTDLARLAATHHGAIIESLLDAIMHGRLGGKAPDDDIALLALRALPMAADRFDLKLPATARSVPVLRHMLQRWLEIGGAAADEIFGIGIAVSEAASNAISHAYDGRDATFEVEGRRTADAVTITIRDTGRWRAPRGRARGRGLHLMRAFVNHVEVDRGESGTAIRLRHTLTPRTLS
jgi:PAS domain S-box-containing protein